jgi:hypothetical protein
LIIDIDNVENVAKKFENCRNWIKATQLNIFGKFQGSEVKAFVPYIVELFGNATGSFFSTFVVY